MSKLIFIQDIDFRGSPAVRAEIRNEVVEEYSSIYKSDKKKMPPPELFTPDGRTFLIGDGLHRISALRKLGQKAVVANVRSGGYEEALAFALLANDRHGIRRSNEDKRKCVEQAIRQWPKKSNLQIATSAGVSDSLVKSVRDWLEAKNEVKPEPVRETSDGRTRTVVDTPPDAPKIKEAKAAKAEAKKVNEVKDHTGWVVPKFCLPFWGRVDEVKELMSHVQHVIGVLKEVQKKEDLMYAEVNISGAIADLDRAWTSIQTAIPYAVCTQCQGHPQTQPKGECRLCKGRGLISKFRWDQLVPAEVKKIRTKPR